MSRIYVAGHTGLLGSAFLRRFAADEQADVITRTHQELDLTDAAAVRKFFERERPDCVFLCAAKVGGIQANAAAPADFVYQNLMIETSVIDAAYRCDVQRLFFFGSSCAYPKYASQPMREEYLGTGELEPTSRPYAVAKLAGMEMCESYNRQYGTCFLTAFPATLYGPGDNFDLETAHVMSALIRKAREAKGALDVWGTGMARREFLYVDDLVDACLFLVRADERTLAHERWRVNVGTGEDIAIGDLARMICRVVGFKGEITFDPSKPNGAPRKVYDVSRMKRLGWTARTGLEEGIRNTYLWYRDS